MLLKKFVWLGVGYGHKYGYGYGHGYGCGMHKILYLRYRIANLDGIL